MFLMRIDHIFFFVIIQIPNMWLNGYGFGLWCEFFTFLPNWFTVFYLCTTCFICIALVDSVEGEHQCYVVGNLQLIIILLKWIHSYLFNAADTRDRHQIHEHSWL